MTGLAAGIIGGLVDGQGEAEALQFIHSEETLLNSERFAELSGQSTRELVDSLAPGWDYPLTVAADGRIFDGNTRSFILQGRGVDINALPRTIWRTFNPADYGGL